MRHLFLALLLLASAPASADSIDKVRDQVVNSLSISGTIEIDAHGKVLRYEIAHPEAYTQGVRDLLARDIPHWTFAPVLIDGAPRAVRADMYLRLQAKPIGGDRYRVEIASAAFGRDKSVPGGGPSARSMTPPRYPSAANRAQVGAMVVTVLRIGRSGKVEEAMVEQTNLRAVARDKDMAAWRTMFEDATLATLRLWKFDPPTTGKEAGAAHWSVRVPVVFMPITDKENHGLGKWESYVPGPRRSVGWDAEGQTAESGIDALPGGGVFPLHTDVRLQTHLGEG